MRGLESLIPRKKDAYDSKEKESVFLIDTDQIKPNPYQPRREFNEEELKNLADSISVHGVLQPIIINKVEREVPSGRAVEYELIAGERRLRAARMANLPRIPAIIKRSTDRQKLEFSLIENIQRNDLNALEEARVFQRLQKEFKMRQVDIAKQVAKSPAYVANTVRILELPENMQASLSKGEINEGHTRPLLSLTNQEHQYALFNEIRQQKLNVRQAEQRARDLLATIHNKPNAIPFLGKTKIDEDLLGLIEEFKNTFNISEAKIKTQGRKIQLAVRFPSKRKFEKWIKGLIN